MAKFPGTSTSPRDFKHSEAREQELVLTRIGFAAASGAGFLVQAEKPPTSLRALLAAPFQQG